MSCGHELINKIFLQTMVRTPNASKFHYVQMLLMNIVWHLLCASSNRGTGFVFLIVKPFPI